MVIPPFIESRKPAFPQPRRLWISYTEAISKAIPDRQARAKWLYRERQLAKKFEREDADRHVENLLADIALAEGFKVSHWVRSDSESGQHAGWVSAVYAKKPDEIDAKEMLPAWMRRRQWLEEWRKSDEFCFETYLRQRLGSISAELYEIMPEVLKREVEEMAGYDDDRDDRWWS